MAQALALFFPENKVIFMQYIQITVPLSHLLQDPPQPPYPSNSTPLSLSLENKKQAKISKQTNKPELRKKKTTLREKAQGHTHTHTSTQFI